MTTPLEVTEEAFKNALKIVQRQTDALIRKAPESYGTGPYEVTEAQIIAAANLALPIISCELEAIAIQGSKKPPEE